MLRNHNVLFRAIIAGLKSILEPLTNKLNSVLRFAVAHFAVPVVPILRLTV